MNIIFRMLSAPGPGRVFLVASLQIQQRLLMFFWLARVPNRRLKVGTGRKAISE